MSIGAAAPSTGANHRRNNFDFLRFFLATAVVFYHSFIVLGRGQTYLGLLAVLGFFGISGYLVTQSWERKRSTLDYFRNRVVRIYPGFVAACLFDHFIVAPLAADSGARYLARIDPVHLVLEAVLLRHTSIRGIFSDLPINSVNASLWTVPYEFVCYILLAIVGTLAFTRRRSRLVALTILVWALGLALPLSVPRLPLSRADARTAEMFLRFATCFLAGAVLYLDRDRIPMTPTLIAAAVALLCLSIWNRALFWVVWPIGLPYVLLWVAFHPRIPLQGWGKFGDFSYGTYVYSFPIQQLLVKYLRPSMNPYSLFLAAMLLTLPVAVFSWYVIERPFLRLKSRSPASPKVVSSGA